MGERSPDPSRVKKRWPMLVSSVSMPVIEPSVAGVMVRVAVHDCLAASVAQSCEVTAKLTGALIEVTVTAVVALVFVKVTASDGAVAPIEYAGKSILKGREEISGMPGSRRQSSALPSQREPPK